MLALKCGLLIDGTEREPIKDAVIVVDQGKIVSVSKASEFEGSSFPGEYIDAEGLTIIPGLINAHVHLAYTGEAVRQQRTEAEEALVAFLNGQKTLAAGVTTVRDCGAGSYAVVKLAQYINKGLITGPRVLSSGRSLTITGGHGITNLPVDGADEVRKATRKNIASGSAFIKMIATGGVLTPGTKVGTAQFSPDEMAAAIYEAKRVGIKTAAHAIGTEGIKISVEAGISSVEHGSFLTEEIVDMMLKQDTFHVPTLSAYYQVVVNGTAAGIPQETVDKAMSAEKFNTDSFKMSYNKGVRFATGTDAGTPYNFHGGIVLELQLMVAAGVPAAEALRAATSNAAELLGLGDKLGTLEPGKIADFAVVEGNPLEDLECLKAINAVYKDGRKV